MAQARAGAKVGKDGAGISQPRSLFCRMTEDLAPAPERNFSSLRSRPEQLCRRQRISIGVLAAESH